MRALLAASLVWAGAAGVPATIPVAVTAPGGVSYELVADGAQRRGSVVGGPATVSDSVSVAAAGATVAVTLRFFDKDGLISSCPRVDVAVPGGRAACRPRFVLTPTQLSYRNFLCELTCEPLTPSGGEL